MAPAQASSLPFTRTTAHRAPSAGTEPAPHSRGRGSACPACHGGQQGQRPVEGLARQGRAARARERQLEEAAARVAGVATEGGLEPRCCR